MVKLYTCTELPGEVIPGVAAGFLFDRGGNRPGAVWTPAGERPTVKNCIDRGYQTRSADRRFCGPHCNTVSSCFFSKLFRPPGERNQSGEISGRCSLPRILSEWGGRSKFAPLDKSNRARGA